MYINRNSDANDAGGAIPQDLAQGLKSKFGDFLTDVEPAETDEDEGGEGGEGDGDEGKNKPNDKSTTTTDDGNTGDDDGAGDNGDGDDNSTPLSYLANVYGIDLEADEDFKDLNLADDSIDAIKSFYDKRETKVKQAAVQELFEAAPVIKDLIEHLENGGSISTWKEEQVTKEFKLEFAADDIDGKAAFMIQVYKDKGISEKRAKLLVEALKDDNELDGEVEKEASAIKQQREQSVADKKKAEQAAYQQEIENTKKVVETVSGIVKKGALINGFVIPEQERKDFNQFILSDKLTEKYEALSYEQRLFMDYMLFKDFKVKALEAKQVATTTNNKPRVTLKSNSGEGNSGSKKDPKQISFEELKALSSKIKS
jgi:hypothetical protein